MRHALLVLAIVLLSGCSPTSPSSQITSDRAIELARPLVDFEPTSITTKADTSNGQPVWTVTFRGGFNQFVEVRVDRNTGEIVRAAIA